MSGKRELLLHICEHPGVKVEDSSTNERWLTELSLGGWIDRRDGGFVATAQALDQYPDFASDDELCGPLPLEPLEERDAVRKRSGWIYERTLPLMRLGSRQKIEGEIPDLETGMNGLVVFGMSGWFRDEDGAEGAREVEITVRIRSTTGGS